MSLGHQLLGPFAISVFTLIAYFFLQQERAYSGLHVSPAWRLDRQNTEAINPTRNMIYSLKVFYFLLYRRRYFLFVSELV